MWANPRPDHLRTESAKWHAMVLLGEFEVELLQFAIDLRRFQAAVLLCQASLSAGRQPVLEL
jgi:hypothetical protein